MADKEAHSPNAYYDCIVIGSGHAGSCAALSAAESGCKRVLIVEKAPQEWSGGNGFFTAGAFRTVHNGLADLSPLVKNLSPGQMANIDMEPYTAEQFTEDIMRLSEGRSDPELVNTVVRGSRDAVEWLARVVRVPFVFSFNRQAYEVNGRQRFWGGMVLAVVDGGKGLMAAHQRVLTERGIEIWYDTPAIRLLQSSDPSSDGAISGIVVRRKGQEIILSSKAVVLAAGGFESSTELRAKHLGNDWANARVRGTPFNTGDGLEMALSIGAARAGDWSYNGCHSTCWDAHADADKGSRTLSNQYTKSGYPLGLILNTQGLRFVDEGADYRNYTYAKYGRAILAQPGGVAFQVFDQRVVKWLRKEEYADEIARKIYADSIEELSQKLILDGLEDPTQFTETIRAYNNAVYSRQNAYPSLRWDPSVKDGLSTHSSVASSGLESKHEAAQHSSSILPNSPGLSHNEKLLGNSREKYISPAKSNWALPLDKPPFLAVKVACGITFTFGGIAVDAASASVLRMRNETVGGVARPDICMHDRHDHAFVAPRSEVLPESSPQYSAGLEQDFPDHVKSDSSEGPSVALEDKKANSAHRRLPSRTLPPIPGLFCAGEMVGGIFYGNYPGGSGLTSGAVFGRLAGRSAATVARKTSEPRPVRFDK